MDAERKRAETEDFAAAFAAVARKALLISPNLKTLRLVGVGPDGKLVIPIALPNAIEDMEGRILAALGTMPKGERMSGQPLAELCGTDKNNGHFQRTMKGLKEAGTVDVHKLYGYRLA